MNPERWNQIKQIYHSALELERGRREEFLREAADGDESILKEVASLLAQEQKSDGVFLSPAVDVLAKALASDKRQQSLTNLTISHYCIKERIGEGGMGVIYRAEDTSLHRHVAIKVLPEGLIHDAERFSRLKREAQVLASINHPNIATLHGFEQVEGQRFIVMELVEGQTLARRLLKGPLPVQRSLILCRQIAEGLEAAHEKGIIHRDLKPDNVMVSADDKVKILDFGIAKALADESLPEDAAHSPQITAVTTREGLILGTAAYMSPEQAKGKPLDKRTDIWSFGCVLFECLTGKRAFLGDTVTETLAAVLKGDPGWQTLPEKTPLKVKDLLHRCLQKDPRERLRDIGDARIVIGESVGQAEEAVAVHRHPSLRWLALSAALALIAGLLTGLELMRSPGRTSTGATVKSVIKIEAGHWLDSWHFSPPEGLDQPTRKAMAISSDGSFIVYSAIAENPGPAARPQLYLRRTDQLEARPIAGTEGANSPFLSPDDRWVGFVANGKLMKVTIDGGVPVTLCDSGMPFGASWGRDNNIVFSYAISGLSRVSADGGKPEELTAPDNMKGGFSHRLPHLLPDDRGVLFTIARDWFDDQPRVALLDLKTRKWSALLDDAADARYVSTGHIVFARQGTLMAVPFDLGKLQLTGQPVPVISNVMQALNTTPAGAWNTAAAQFEVSDSGCLVYVPGGIMPYAENSLIWVDKKGNTQPVASLKAPFFAPRLSPDAQRISYTNLGKQNSVWVYDLNRGIASRLTGECDPVWSIWTPDGKRVIFNWKDGLKASLYWELADGSQPMERLTTTDLYHSVGSFHPDGNTLAFVQCENQNTGADIFLLDLRSRRITPFLNSPAMEEFPEFSPDGHWMAYASDESGKWEVYVRPFPGPGGRTQVSSETGTQPLWARNGKQLFFLSGDDQQVWAADVQTDGGFSTSKPHFVVKMSGFQGSNPIRNWDISPDGQRFLLVKPEERKAAPVTEMILVQNWFEELKRLVPTQRN